MLNHIGTQNIETSRLILRKFKMQDAKQMFENWAGDPDNVEFMRWPVHKSVQETEKIIANWVEQYNDIKNYNWCITWKETQEVIGSITVNDLIELRESCEIGYIISKKFWNKGIMTEALHAVLEYLFKKVGFHRIQLRHDAANPASGKVMIKNGLKFEGLLRESERLTSGIWSDAALYSILNSEFE